MANTQSRELEFTPQALDSLTNIHDRLAGIREIYGRESTEYAKATESVAFSLIQTIRLGGNIQADGDLGLWCSTQVGIVMGVVFHRESVTRIAELPDEYQIAGTWSCHS